MVSLASADWLQNVSDSYLIKHTSRRRKERINATKTKKNTPWKKERKKMGDRNKRDRSYTYLA